MLDLLEEGAPLEIEAVPDALLIHRENGKPDDFPELVRRGMDVARLLTAGVARR